MHGVFSRNEGVIRKKEHFYPLQIANEEQQLEIKDGSCRKHLSHDYRYPPNAFPSPEVSEQGPDGPQALPRLQEAAHSAGWATGSLVALGDHRMAGENSVFQEASARVTQLLTVG